MVDGMADALIAESTTVFQDKLTELLGGLGLRIVGKVTDPLQLRMAISAARPDLLVLDDSFFEPVPTAPHAWPAVDVEQLVQEFPDLSILVLSALGVDHGVNRSAMSTSTVTAINKEDMLTELPRVVQRFMQRLRDREGKC